jgi:lipopolysaccharide export system permease protein
MIVDNEVTILKNCGLNKIQICRPTFKIAIFCSLFCYLISFYLMPYANKELRNAKRYLTSNYASLSFTPKTFENLNNLTIYIKDRDSDNNLVGILIHDKRPIKYSLTITAEKGYISAENNSALLYMENGTIQRFNHEQVKSEIINFDNYVFNLSDNSSIDDKKILKPRERTINELLSYNDYFDDGVEPEEIRAEIHQRLTYPLLSINLSMIGLAFILRGSFSRRGNTKNIVLAIICSASLVAITTMIYSFIVNAPQFIAALYMVMVLFFIANLRMLKKN